VRTDDADDGAEDDASDDGGVGIDDDDHGAQATAETAR
jgi:hypothetical protein